MSVAIKRLILLLLSVLLSLGVVEILLRGIGYGVITPEMNFGVNTQMALDRGSFLPDADLFWKLPINPQDGLIRAVNPEVEIPAKGDRPRVLVLGDSCSRISMGPHPYSALLEHSLGEEKAEVWNASVPGYTVWQGRAWLQRQLLAMKPDVTVVYFGWNDHWRSTGTTDENYAGRLNSSRPRLFSLFKSNPDPAPLRIPQQQYGEILTDMVQQLQAAGSQVILVAAPANLTGEAKQRLVQTGYMVAGDRPMLLHGQYLTTLRAAGRQTGATVLDAYEVFQRLGAGGRLIMRDGIHLTDPGHQAMAAMLSRQVKTLLIEPAPDPGDLENLPELINVVTQLLEAPGDS